MHIKKLEISGFKSFVDRTAIHFDHDVIAVVGPNGCGKSNIVDAIRWCMGEQSAKHLRGRAMEDVIFNGSESRPPNGLAEVTLTFDNSDPKYRANVPPEVREFPELSVTRRLFRDGTSEYLINKTQVRLRDVTELFLGTGVGTKAYSIVEQGRIGQIVSARPEDRRLYIEEAAGITKYRQRRRQAERKMELTRQNLLRINDIVAEIERSRSSLKRQVAKAERFLQYRAELDDLVLHDASHRWLENTVSARVRREELAVSSEKAGDLRHRLATSELELEGERKRAQETEDRADRAARAAFEADNEVTSLQADIERARDRLDHLDQRLMAAKAEQRDVVEARVRLEGEQQSLSARIQELSGDERARQMDAAAETTALDQLRSEEQKANQAVEALRREASQTEAQVAASAARLEALAQRIHDARTRKDKLSGERDCVKSELQKLVARLEALKTGVAEAAEGKRLTSSERENLEQEVTRLRARVLGSEQACDSARNELNLKRNRLQALQDLHRRLEGVGAGVRALLTGGHEAVLGMVADRLEAPEKLTAALAGLLGERLQCVVVQDQDLGLELLRELQREQRGRASIIPARVERDALPPIGAPASQPGIIGRLASQLSYSDEDEGLVRALVGEALLVESPEVALKIHKDHPGLTAVSLDGTVVRSDGSVSGGSGDDVASAMLEQKREMHQLADEIATLQRQHENLSGARDELQTRLVQVETALDQARQEAHAGELAHVSAEKDLARFQSEQRQTMDRHASLEQELADISQVLADTSREEADGRRQLDEIKAALGKTRHALQRADDNATSWKERVEGQAGLVTERKVRLAQVQEQADAARGSAERVESQLEELGTREQRLDGDAEEAAYSFGQTAAQLQKATERRISAADSANAAHAKLDAVRAELEQTRQALGTKEESLRQLRAELQHLDESVRGHEMTLQRFELEMNHLLGTVRERFRGLDLRRVLGDFHARPAPDGEHRRRIEDLTTLIDRMGPVNLDARAEYDSAEKRFTELSTQKIDIEKALEELERAIKHMNRESRRRFRETFDSVDALFRKMFKTNFRGGRAELVLTDPDDLLGTGVDIVAQPPGKKLGNIELMSGGEKALTAVSLIFAIFQHRPAPFCVLDEVDAPLDEANVARYNDAIRTMTDRSQFILITHVRTTMQRVDVLYGVTMGEPGVSRLVSVKVNDNAVARSERNQLSDEAASNSGKTQVA